ncbi:hypothetical protein EHM76_00115 [bacterium]|nr:MAG: hypothetical protein EHM76_00115 [bacterium]
MSDIATAPAPAAPAPPPNEVVIDTSPPIASSSPVGAQTPDKPVEAKPALSRRESIQRAFDRAAQAKPREAKMGDNNPPEPMEREQPKLKSEPPKELNLRKRPSEQEDAPETTPRARAEHGHFAPREPAQQAQQPQRQIRQLPNDAPFRDAPPRMDETARAEWHATPESVRGAVHRMHHEFGRAYEQYRGDHETMKTIRPFERLARTQGTTLQRALTNYVNMETKLRNDPVGGLDVIVNNLNLRTPEGQQLTLHDIAWNVVNQTPEQQQILQARNAQAAQLHQLKQAQARIAQLEKHAQAMQYQQQFVHTRGALDQYATSHPRLDELGDLIEQEIKLGFDLDTAYRRAELLRPGTQAPQTRNGTQAAQTRNATAQTRTPDRSISGSAPAGPSNGHARPRAKVSRRDAIANAIKSVSGSL